MNSKTTGGPAFPCQAFESAVDSRLNTYANDGMTLIDYFAAQAIPIAALGAMVPGENHVRSELAGQVASNAYEIATAMIAERNRIMNEKP